ncbi:unnamed protein product [Rhizophagus irregularis]|nr:unnamed protein product [Rhizophagus irregularis]
MYRLEIEVTKKLILKQENETSIKNNKEIVFILKNQEIILIVYKKSQLLNNQRKSMETTQSPWFKTILSDNKKKDEENIVIDLPNISSSTFNILLKYLYYGEINISLLSGKDIFELLIAMNELKINGMSDFLQDILLISHENWFQENFFFTYKISLKHQELQKLQKHFDKIIQYQPDMLFYSKDFVKIDKDLLIDVIKKDNLVMSEIDIWRKLILWGKESVNNSKI